MRHPADANKLFEVLCDKLWAVVRDNPRSSIGEFLTGTLENTEYRSHAKQEAAINRYLSWRNRKRNISIQSWKSYRRQKKTA